MRDDCDSARGLIRAFLIEALPEVAHVSQTEGAIAGRQYINERDHFRPWSIAALSGRAAVAKQVTVGGEGAHGLAQEWPRLGKVDVVVTAPEGTAFVELKCGPGNNVLGPCAWDVLKLAFALSREATCAAFLMAAAPRTLWERRVPGSDLFQDGSWTAQRLRTAFAPWWCTWEEDRTPGRPEGFHPPSEVPRGFSTTLLGVPADFLVGGQVWQVRAAEVQVADASPSGWTRFRT